MASFGGIQRPRIVRPRNGEPDELDLDPDLDPFWDLDDEDEEPLPEYGDFWTDRTETDEE